VVSPAVIKAANKEVGKQSQLVAHIVKRTIHIAASWQYTNHLMMVASYHCFLLKSMLSYPVVAIYSEV